MKLLAVDWNQHQIRLVLVQSQQNRLAVEHLQSIAVALPSDAEPPSVEAQWESARRRLLEALKESRYRGAEVVVAVRRADVELRLMSLPPVPPEELPVIVKMQALREFSEVSDDWPLDYLPLHGTNAESMVLAAVISPRKLQAYRQIFAEADLKPRSFVLRPTATALLVTQLDDSMRPKVELCVDEMESECEMSVLREGTPILIRTLQVPRGEHFDRLTYLNQEIRRTIVASQNQLQGEAVQRVVLFGVTGDGTETLGVQLSERLQLPVRVLNPFAASQLQSKQAVQSAANLRQYAAAMGLLVAHSINEPELIDFGNPRRPAPPKSNRNLITGVLTGVLAVGGMLVGGFYWHLSSLEGTARQLQAKIARQKKLVESSDTRVAQLRAIEQWTASDVNWLAEMHDMSQNLPGPEQVKVVGWQATLLPNGDGQVVVNLMASQASVIGQINQSLRGERRRVEGSGGDMDANERTYPWLAKQTVTIANNVPQLKPTTPRRRTPRRGEE